MIEIERRPGRKVEQFSSGKPGLQVTRIPNYRRGCWVVMKPDAPQGLGGKVLEVQKLTCSVEEKAVWRIHFSNGRCVLHSEVERFATDTEITDAQKRRQSI